MSFAGSSHEEIAKLEGTLCLGKNELEERKQYRVFANVIK